MKKTLLVVLLTLCVLPAHAQYVALKKETFTTVANGSVVRLIGSAASFHKMTWNKIGTVTVCTIKVEQSATGTGGWSDLITSQDCSVNGTTTIVTGTPNYIRTVTITTFTGTGSVVSVYTGYINNPTGGGGSPAFSAVTSGTNTATLVVGTGGTLDSSGTGTVNANKIGGRPITITTPTANDALVDNGTGYVNTVLGLPSRADNDGTVVLATTDRNQVVNFSNASPTAISIAQAGVTAGNGFIGGFQTILCNGGAGLGTLTPATSTINSYATLTLRQFECARIFVPTEADTNYLAVIDGGQFIEINVELFAPATATATGDGKAYFLVGPKLNGLTLINMYSQVVTAGTTNATNIGLDRCVAAATSNACSSTVADMLSVNQTIDSAENSSDTAATAVTINASNAQVTAGQVLRFNVDAISTTPANGLQVTLRFRK